MDATAHRGGRLRIEEFADEHLDGVVALCLAEGWESWTPERAAPALQAPGTVAVVAVENGAVVGAASALTDRSIVGYLGILIVAPHARRRGIGRRLVEAIFDHVDLTRLDLMAADDALPFYRTFPHREMSVVRLYSAEDS